MKITIPPFALTALFASLFLMPLSSLAQEKTGAFPDLEDADPSVEAIAWMKAEGIVEGYPDGTFKSLNKINRAEFMKIVVEATEADADIKGANCFSDVKNEWFAKYVCTGKTMGIVSGYPDGTFRPANNINFAEASKIITNALGLEKDNAAAQDPQEPWYRTFVAPLSAEGAIPSSISDFDKPIARGEMAEVIWRVKEDPQDLNALTYEELEAEPIQVTSCDALKTLFLERHAYEMPLAFEEDLLEEAESTDEFANVKNEAPQASPEESSGDDSRSYSETNVQVQGVDEADIVKTDGTYIYVVNDEKLRIIKAYPETEMHQIAEIDIDAHENGEDFDFSPSEVYVDNNTLTVIGTGFNYRTFDYGRAEDDAMEGERLWFPGFHQSRTGVFLYDISNKSAPVLKRQMEFDGDYSESRKVDDTLYLVMNKFDFNYYAFDAENADAAAIKEALPLYYDSQKGGEQLIADCSNIRYFPRERSLNYLIASAIPLENNDPVASEVFIGNSENIYASRDNLYIAATNYDENDYYFDSNNARTIVYRFALAPGQIKYESRGKVPGTILNQFSMDEHENHLRIATTEGWGDDSTNNVYVLNGAMSITGKLNNLAPGERIYSTRFMGDRGYMVTFKQVDPLFVFDLSDPANPRKLGELKIPGFSNYLHPYDENHIIGFGRDVVEVTRSDVWSDETFTFARQEGFKMALFDVANPAQPVQMFTEVIGGTGTYSELLYDHKALLFDREKNLIAFPIQIYDYDNVIPLGGIADENDAEAIQADEFNGAYAYTVSLENGFQLRGKIEHPSTTERYEYTTTRCETDPLTDEETCTDETSTDEYTYPDTIRRLLYIGETLYSIGEKWLRASDLATTEQKTIVEME